MSRARIIPFLLLREGSLVKTRRFAGPKYIGDPINAVKIFNEKEVDELVLLDIAATAAGRDPDYGMIGDIASEAFMPIGYGGGINTLGQIERLFKAGVEKVSLNSVLFENPALVAEAARIFGSQSIVASIDVKRDFLGRQSLYSHSGRHRQRVDVLDHARRLEALGVGELALQSIDRDGMMGGYDLAFIDKVAKSVSIPVICIGGAGTVEHLREGLRAGASAAGAGAMFVFHGRHNAVLISYTDPAAVHA
ncbi:AglZ/HisF2 family acetamidino modification protein [Sphingomonas hankookensis]|uniref:AglZ/HisF2 family acetamidino modification protein n=1 Tax=Sphingomonas hankookensis TaxID=563996 RepID=UPI001F582333|nr:AglZ/HisF2 family acetamidino modification protein [Sphingomonas hankookensis]